MGFQIFVTHSLDEVLFQDVTHIDDLFILGDAQVALALGNVSITFQCVLVLLKRRKTLTSDACSRPPIIIRSHNLHIDDIRGSWVR
jgi:hypothetical protein